MMPRSEERGCRGEGRDDAEERGERMPRGGERGCRGARREDAAGRGDRRVRVFTAAPAFRPGARVVTDPCAVKGLLTECKNRGSKRVSSTRQATYDICQTPPQDLLLPRFFRHPLWTHVLCSAFD